MIKVCLQIKWWESLKISDAPMDQQMDRQFLHISTFLQKKMINCVFFFFHAELNIWPLKQTLLSTAPTGWARLLLCELTEVTTSTNSDTLYCHSFFLYVTCLTPSQHIVILISCMSHVWFLANIFSLLFLVCHTSDS